jgi:hypothetical protein
LPERREGRQWKIFSIRDQMKNKYNFRSGLTEDISWNGFMGCKILGATDKTIRNLTFLLKWSKGVEHTHSLIFRSVFQSRATDANSAAN